MRYSLLKTLTCLLLAVCTGFCTSLGHAAGKPKIVIVATGGTIAGASISSVQSAAYKSAAVPVDRLIAALPEMANVAEVRGEQLFQVPSENFNAPRLLQLGKYISDLLRRDDVHGVVITHGVDTLEETAFFLNLTLKSGKPVVLVGAMRPTSALSADGAANLYNAVRVAANRESANKGVLVVMNDEIHSARDVSMRDAGKLETMQSLYGPLGLVTDENVYFYRQLARPHTLSSEFDIDTLVSLPRVDIVYSYGGVTPTAYDALAEAGTRAIIHAGTGNGSVPEQLISTLFGLRQQGIQIVRASRTGAGIVTRDGEQPDSRFDWLVAADLSPQKARILMQLALTRTNDTAALQDILWKY